MGAASPVFQQPDACPCCNERCSAFGAKLTKYGHLIGCGCPECMGRRNQRKGKRAQARGYRRAGGTAPFTPGHEENQGVLSLEICVESKAGKQVPKSLVKFTETDWCRRALSQAERAIPAGVQAYPAVYAEPAGGGAWLVVRVAPSEIRKVAR